jgi:AraC-like DNA-binding protein
MVEQQPAIESGGPGRSEFRTSDPARAHDWIKQAFDEYEVHVRAMRPDFEFRGVQSNYQGFALSRLRFPMASEMVVPSADVIVVAEIFRGRYGFADRQSTVVGRAGEMVLPPTDHEVVVTWDMVDIGVVTLTPADVMAVAAETTGMAPEELTFAGGLPVSVEAAQHWRQIVSTSRQTMHNPHAAGSPIIRSSLSRLLAASLLSSFQNTSLGYSRHRELTGVASVRLRRALHFIDDHAHEPISLADIAAAAGIGPRALQLSFRRVYDTTPHEYLQKVRLAGAHHALVEGNPQLDSVGAIAARWGFSHAGRFSATYAGVYGTTPSITLRS